jgi:KilA-N domain
VQLLTQRTASDTMNIKRLRKVSEAQSQPRSKFIRGFLMLSVFEFNSKGIRFEQRGDRVWACLTDMAKASGKKVNHWNDLKSTSEFIQELESIAGIPVMVSNPGGTPETTGTWAVEEVAIDFAAWCNVKFRIWVAQQIRILMSTGKVELLKQQEFPSRVVAVETAEAIAKIHETMFDIDPRIAQILVDHAMRDVADKAVLLSSYESKLAGVVEIAKDLGFKVGKEESTLGRKIAAAWRLSTGMEPQECKRECGGASRPIKAYPRDNEVVIKAIKEFYNAI